MELNVTSHYIHLFKGNIAVFTPIRHNINTTEGNNVGNLECVFPDILDPWIHVKANTSLPLQTPLTMDLMSPLGCEVLPPWTDWITLMHEQLIWVPGNLEDWLSSSSLLCPAVPEWWLCSGRAHCPAEGTSVIMRLSETVFGWVKRDR